MVVGQFLSCFTWIYACGATEEKSMARVLSLLKLLLLTLVVKAWDPDPVKDYCIPPPETSQCKKEQATGVDFASKVLRNKFNNQSSQTFSAILVSVSNFPALNTMGLSLARADLGVGGVVSLHSHPRASELVYVAEGVVEAGFIDSNNVLLSHTLQQGDMLIIPRGFIHYQYNVGKTRATLFASFNGQDPGLLLTGPNLFASGLPDAVLASSLLMEKPEIDALKGKFKPAN